MRIFIALLVALAVAGPVQAAELASLTFAETYRPATVIETEAPSSPAGGRVLRIEAPHSALICLGEQAGLHVRNEVIWYQARLKVAGATGGGAFLEMWCESADGKRFFSRGLDQMVKEDADWTEVRIPMRVDQGVEVVRVIMNVVLDGPGKVWVADVRLSSEPLP